MQGGFGQDGEHRGEYRVLAGENGPGGGGLGDHGKTLGGTGLEHGGLGDAVQGRDVAEDE